MKIISHRGNINGPLPEKENRPSYIDCALQLGYETEIDLRWIDGSFWLGHDEPQYQVDLSWLKLRKNNLWIHCKNQESAIQLSKLNDNYKYFCHVNDDFVLTSTKQLWVHNLNSKIDETCIIPLIEKSDILKYQNDLPSAVCTDFVNICKAHFAK